MKEKLPNFFAWHFVIVPREVLTAWKNFLIFNFHFFSTGLLLKTLFSPWKRMTMEEERPGFHPEEFFTVLTFNLISRSIGILVRLSLIFWSLLGELSLLFLGSVFFLLAFLTPLVSWPTFLAAAGKQAKKLRLFSLYQTDPGKFVAEFVKSRQGKFIFDRLGIEPKKVLEMKIGGNLPSCESISAAFLSLVEQPPLSDLFADLKIGKEDLEEVLTWFDREEENKAKQARFWAKDNLLHRPALAWSWNYGYTPNLDAYSLDLTREQAFSSHLVGRNQEVKRMEAILSRSSQSNMVLVGEEGVGKRTVVLQFADSIREGRVIPGLKHKRVLEVNVNKVIGEGKTTIEAQNKFEDILTEAQAAGNIILVIPGLDRFVASEAGRIDLSPVLAKKAVSSRLQIIGITTPALYQKYLYHNQTVSKLFSVIEVEPPTKQEAVEILETFACEFEKDKKILITFPAIKEAVEKSERYITDIPFPEKAIDLLDETVVSVLNAEGKLVTAREIDEVLSAKTKVPVGEIAKEEKEKLIDLEKIIHRRLVDQEEAVVDLANAFRRARVDLSQRKKPAGVFLFLGPTGVGKTETAKALAEAYFGSEQKLVRLDMNEFQDEGANIRLLGYFEKGEPGIMARLLRENPFCVLLLDEIEKAAKPILNLFLTAFDEGYLTDNLGKRYSLREMIIICTSNAGAEFIRERVGRGTPVESFKAELMEFLLQNHVFLPEFLNRFDSVVVYKPLNQEHLKQIARLMLESLNKKLTEKRLQIKITDSLLEKLVLLGNDPVFGARPMRRLLQDRVEAPLAQKILKGEVTTGEIEVSL